MDDFYFIPIKRKIHILLDFVSEEEYLIKDKNLRVNYGNAGRKSILDSYDQKVVIKKYVEEIRKIIKLA